MGFDIFICLHISDWLQLLRCAIFVLVYVCCWEVDMSSYCCLGVSDTALSETWPQSSSPNLVKDVIASAVR